MTKDVKGFDKSELEFYLPDVFKGLDKNYILCCIFDSSIQKNWIPRIGDIIVGCTGNIFVISNIEQLHQDLGGTRYYFGGGSCNKDGGNIADSTYCNTANESGIFYHPLWGEMVNLYHTSIRNFRYVPYPHELIKNII